MPKLTLSADSEVIEKAKQFAMENNTSVSSMFDRFVRTVVGHGEVVKSLGEITKKATGVITLSKSKSDRQHLENALAEKYRL